MADIYTWYAYRHDIATVTPTVYYNNKIFPPTSVLLEKDTVDILTTARSKQQSIAKHSSSVVPDSPVYIK